jgi:Transposase IS4
MKPTAHHKMVQKRHQEEISGPSDSTEAAATATELRASKRTRFQSSKAAENELQRSLKDVPFQPPKSSKLTPIPTPTPTRNKISTSFKDLSQQASYSVETSQNKAQAFQKKEEWLRQFEGAKNKAEKRKILTNHLGNTQPFPQKLDIGPIPSVPEEAFPNADYFDPHTLFYRFFPSEIFQEIADNTNEYAHQEIAKKKSEIPSGNRWTKLGRKRGTPMK